MGKGGETERIQKKCLFRGLGSVLDLLPTGERDTEAAEDITRGPRQTLLGIDGGEEVLHHGDLGIDIGIPGAGAFAGAERLADLGPGELSIHRSDEISERGFLFGILFL
jgi:hypothetical protein